MNASDEREVGRKEPCPPWDPGVPQLPTAAGSGSRCKAPRADGEWEGLDCQPAAKRWRGGVTHKESGDAVIIL